MKTADFSFSYPEQLVAHAPATPSRVMWVEGGHGSSSEPPWRELTWSELKAALAPGDLLLLNDSGVVPRRVFAEGGTEILFVREESPQEWQVLFPARASREGDQFALPGGVTAHLLAKGLPQKMRVDRPLSDSYFEQFGEYALPPYIQKARGERHNRDQEGRWYQTDWWRVRGSCAAPTASLHFSRHDLENWRERGVAIGWTTLHVGLGTFLPIKSTDLEGHQMHREWCFVSRETSRLVHQTRDAGGRIWTLGTTATRAIESWARGLLQETPEGWEGETDLFIRPGFEFQVVDVLLTNFHQPESTLLALVCAFAGREKVLAAYEWAVSQKFRLFSYGDLTVWER